jgi:hypothetical protein
MPPLPPVAKVIKFTFLSQQGSNSRIFNHLFFAYSGTLSLADLITLVTTARTAWQTNITTIQITSVALLQVTGTDLSTPSSPTNTQTSTTVGTNGGAHLPDGTSMVIQLKINRRYRGGHPRLYLFGLSQAGLSTDNTWTPSYLASFVNGIQAVITAIQTAPPAAVGTMTPVNVSYFSGFTVSAPAGKRAHNVPVLRGTPFQDAVIATAGNNKVASQRRRNLQSL